MIKISLKCEYSFCLFNASDFYSWIGKVVARPQNKQTKQAGEIILLLTDNHRTKLYLCFRY